MSSQQTYSTGGTLPGRFFELTSGTLIITCLPDQLDVFGAKTDFETDYVLAFILKVPSDRADVVFAVKELYRSMSKPTTRDRNAPKRLGRYLVGRQGL